MSGTGLKACLTSAEKIDPERKNTIAEAFRCKVFDVYGGRELSTIAMECGCGGYHVADDIHYLELLDDEGRPAEPGETGQIIITSLTNFCMPFIRYQNGDMAAAAETGCECGRGLSRLESIEGRIQELIVTPSGKCISGVIFPHLFKDFDIRLYRVEQNRVDGMKVYIVPGAKFSKEDLEYCRTIMMKNFEGMEIGIELVRDLKPSSSGKFRFVVSTVKNPFTG